MPIRSEIALLQAVICFSHLRWNFVFQRPQHLLTRLTTKIPVHFWEEPVFASEIEPELQIAVGADDVTVVTPRLPHGLLSTETDAALRLLLDDYLVQQGLTQILAWYYTPMAIAFTNHLTPEAVVYDCMDELSAFQGAPPELIEREQKLFAKADVVFAGGASLYESKRNQHDNVHLFPSSIDRKHFAAAREFTVDPSDQSKIPSPRIGFFGVLDERMDRDLLRAIAKARPDWHFVLIGPVVKIQHEDLPHGDNLHYLGPKAYADLPTYLANWDVAMLPFAQNASTKFISPTKTPEYLAAGKPVVSTPIRDVVKPYGEQGMVHIAESPAEFVVAIERSLQPTDARKLATVEEYLNSTSWDKTFQEMMTAIAVVLANRSQPANAGVATDTRSGSHV